MIDFGLSAAESGLNGATLQMGVVADNLANVGTPGFNAAEAVALAGPGQVVQPAANGATQNLVISTGQTGAAPVLTTTQGPLTPGASTDLALTVPGYFPVRTANGIALTRDGQFERNATGNLVTANGGVLLDLALKPVVVPATGWSISNGSVLGPAGQVLAQLGIANVPNPSGMTRITGGYVPGAQSGAATYAPALGGDVMQGYLEGANTNPALQMANLVAIQGQFQLLTDVVTQAATLSRLTAQMPPTPA